MGRVDPLSLPEWQALHREASLVSQIIGSGITALGKASYGSGLGEYYTAFFGLSIGVERLAKLILVADYAIENGGNLPNQAIVKNYGHGLVTLVERVEDISKKRGLSEENPRPKNPICKAVVECLDNFANASKGRYANFEEIGNPSFDRSHEPVNKWWTEVVEPILDKHYRGKAAEKGVKERAKAIDEMLGNRALVLHTSETGDLMQSVAVASERTGQTKSAQKYGRYYTLLVVRWMAEVFSEMTSAAGYKPSLECLFGHHKFFQTYTVEDSFLLTRKVWPLT
jgi:hypothetical protein